MELFMATEIAFENYENCKNIMKMLKINYQMCN